jgi:hypothetical protein
MSGRYNVAPQPGTQDTRVRRAAGQSCDFKHPAQLVSQLAYGLFRLSPWIPSYPQVSLHWQTSLFPAWQGLRQMAKLPDLRFAGSFLDVTPKAQAAKGGM